MDSSEIKFIFAHNFPCDCTYDKNGENVITCGSDCSVFNIFINRLHYMIKMVNINYYIHLMMKELIVCV